MFQYDSCVNSTELLIFYNYENIHFFSVRTYIIIEVLITIKSPQKLSSIGYDCHHANSDYN